MAIVINGTTGIETPSIYNTVPFIENDQAIAADYTVVTNRNAASIGDITINTGVTVTIAGTANWVIL